MSGLSDTIAGSDRRYKEMPLVIILLVICLTLFFFRLGTRPLWDVDEGMHAATSKDMVLSGDWVTPTFNGENFYDKPILYNWLAALSFLVLGFTEFAARLPAAILGLGCVVVTYLLGRRMFGPTVGFLGGVILAANPEYIILSRSVVHDISLVFFVTLALFFFYSGFTSQNRRTTYLMLFYASCGFAVLAKGPLGVVLPAMIIGLFLVLKRNLRFLREMQLGWGTLVFLVVAAPWYVLISLRNSDYAGYFFIQQNLMNFVSAEARHPRPFYYYFPLLLGGFFPWSLFLPLALVRALGRRLKGLDEGTLFLLLWFVGIFLFFSVASSKLPPYILPSFPAAALLVGSLWHDLLSDPTPGLRRGFLYSSVPMVVVFPLATVYLLINPPTYLITRYDMDVIRIYLLAFTITGFAGLSFFTLLRRRYKASFSANVGLLMAGIILFIVLIVPSINPDRTTKGLAQQLDGMIAPGEDFVFFHKVRDSALFYANRRAVVVDDPDELITYLTSHEKAFCIIDKRYFQKLEKLKKISTVLDREGKDLLISANSAA